MPAWLAVVPAISALLDKIIPDKDERDKALNELKRLEAENNLEFFKEALSADKGQMAVNEVEAGHRNLFVAGWRPFIGWVCGVAFAYHFILQPIIIFAMINNGQEVKTPDFDIEALFTVLMGMLGLGGLRTFEKIKGVSK